ncbi:MAG: hypothetical protein ACYTEE_09870, partial [Planctomycetota bacterium]
MNDGRSKLIIYFIILLLAIVLITKLLFKSGSFEWDSEGIDDQREVAVLDVNGSWPMFHGEPNLVGQCQNKLPNSLRIIWK